MNDVLLTAFVRMSVSMLADGVCAMEMSLVLTRSCTKC